MSKVFIEIAYRVSCKTVFFLVNYTILILLGQPFARKMKLSLEHSSDSSIDATFIDLSTQETCIVIVVALLQKDSIAEVLILKRKPKSMWQSYVKE